jgi:AcrR family transcriptional regulator
VISSNGSNINGGTSVYKTQDVQPAMDQPSPDPRPLRADARRNRDKLLDVAATAFAEEGVNASLEDIARRAGVGIGTLYRHFPTREHLVEQVYRHELEALGAAADELARQHPPDVALEEWMQRFVFYIAAKRGMADSLRILMTTNSDLFAKASGLVPLTLQRLLDAAAAAGTIRSDVEASDILQALSGLYSAPAGPDWQPRARRLMGLMMDGLRWGASRA